MTRRATEASQLHCLHHDLRLMWPVFQTATGAWLAAKAVSACLIWRLRPAAPGTQYQTHKHRANASSCGTYVYGLGTVVLLIHVIS